jgi:hypothetical protein
MADFYARKCPDCQSSMSPIQIVDNTVAGLGLGSVNIDKQKALEYVVPGTKPSFFDGTLKTAGEIVALMCDRCARILLFGRPHNS